MYVISKLKSMVRIEPKDFYRELSEAISDALNAKLANKVLKDVGKHDVDNSVKKLIFIFTD